MIYNRPIFYSLEKHLTGPEAIILCGMRRTGKTTAIKYIKEKHFRENSLYMDMENPLNRKIFENDNYESIKKFFEFQGMDFSKKPKIFLDEVQLTQNIPSAVKYLMDNYQIKFFLTGSASFHVKNLFRESLAGRKYLFEIYPLSFMEFLSFKECSLSLPEKDFHISEELHKTLLPYFDEYIAYGGFPGVVLKETSDEKKMSIEDIFTSFFQNEIVLLKEFRKTEKIRDLIILLIQRVGSKLDVSKLSSELKISRPTLQNYLTFLKDSFFLETIQPYSTNAEVEIRKTPKVYVCDTGFLSLFPNIEKGKILENAVFQNLRIKGCLNYYQTKSGQEIDFILDKKEAYEVKQTATEQDVKKLKNISQKLGLKTYRVLTYNFSPLENTSPLFIST